MGNMSTLKKCDRNAWTRLTWFSIGTSESVSYEHGKECAGGKNAEKV